MKSSLFSSSAGERDKKFAIVVKDLKVVVGGVIFFSKCHHIKFSQFFFIGHNQSQPVSCCK